MGTLKSLGKVQKEILEMLTKGLTTRQIASRRGTSVQAAHEIVRKLIDKGYFNQGTLIRGGYKSSTQFFTGKGQMRLHAQRFKIKVQSSKYDKKRLECDRILIKGVRVYLHATNIEIVATDSIVFYGVDADDALDNSMRFWDWFFSILEHDLGIIILKDRKQNMKATLAHYAKENAMEAEGRIDDNVYRIRASEDGKTWLLYDKSKGFAERETVHPGTAHVDAVNTDLFFNDLRDYSLGTGEPILLTDIVKLQREQAFLNKESAAGLLGIINLLKPKDEMDEDKIKRLGKPYYVG